ncbi:Uncharacterized protein XB16_3547 [Leptospira santarosai]|uniref:Uncharacterized protein n=1 Tax=Leptospira santarosai TaxID=28183 RepID=A0A2P1QY67_9LEPT|nr:Uncharacterized protein XB16_3547 [Leptospira santarosai]
MSDQMVDPHFYLFSNPVFKHFQNVTELEKKQIDESYFENTTVDLFFKCNVLKIIQYLSRKLKASLYSMQ